MSEEHQESIDLFACLTEKEKRRGRRKGLLMAKWENTIYKIKKLIRREHESN